MISEERKNELKVDNSAFRDRFRFLFSANDHIICERFFKINYFNNASLHSEELRQTIANIVSLIQNDLVSKSRIYTWYTTETPVKITGFKENGAGFASTDGEYIVYPKREEKKLDETEETQEVKKTEPFDLTFKFEFQMAQKIETNPEDGKPIFSDYRNIYSAMWDATVYPKEVRNSVDLSNSLAAFKKSDASAMNFQRNLIYRMSIGKQDLIYDIIKRICEVTSGEGKTYTNSMFYGNGETRPASDIANLKKYNGKSYYFLLKTENGYANGYEKADVYISDDKKCWVENPDGSFMGVKEYSYDPYNKYVKGWETAVREKTENYRREVGRYGR